MANLDNDPDKLDFFLETARSGRKFMPHMFVSSDFEPIRVFFGRK